jgi:hypothetical protein
MLMITVGEHPVKRAREFDREKLTAVLQENLIHFEPRHEATKMYICLRGVLASSS